MISVFYADLATLRICLHATQQRCTSTPERVANTYQCTFPGTFTCCWNSVALVEFEMVSTQCRAASVVARNMANEVDESPPYLSMQHGLRAPRGGQGLVARLVPEAKPCAGNVRASLADSTRAHLLQAGRSRLLPPRCCAAAPRTARWRRPSTQALGALPTRTLVTGLH